MFELLVLVFKKQSHKTENELLSVNCTSIQVNFYYFNFSNKIHRSERKAVFVPINRDLQPTVNPTGKENGIHTENPRKMSTQREIYLPDRVPMSALNNGYIGDAQEPKEIPKKFETDSIEVC